MAETLLGLSGQQYIIQSHIQSGGEGGVYNVDKPDLVAKIYDTSKTNIDVRLNELEEKVKYMVNHRIPTKFPDGTVIVTWPQDVLYKDGKFAGYIMPKISGAKPIYMLNRGGSYAESVIPGYNWKTALSVASNLAYIVSFLHSKGVVIGDMNSDNLLVYPNGLVVIIDTDSFDLWDQTMNRHYKCCVGTEEFLPPELQGCNLERASAQYTQYSDDFALAVHIFQLLMNNVHPFNARVISDYKQSLPENSQNHNISVGNCPFLREIVGCEAPLGSLVMDELLPDYLIEDFKRTFDYQLDLGDAEYTNKLKTYMKNRTSASEWHRDLKRLLNDGNLVQCGRNREHFYLSSKGHCEMCDAVERRQKVVSKPAPKPAPKSASQSTPNPNNNVKIKKGTGKKWKVFCIILLVTCVASGIFAVYQWNEALQYRNMYHSKWSDYYWLEDLYEELAEQTEFMNEYIAIIDANSYDGLYHTYDCTTWNWSDVSWIAYNVNKAEALGYEPCPECH